MQCSNSSECGGATSSWPALLLILASPSCSPSLCCPLAYLPLQEIALRTPGFAGADLANLLNEAAILAGRKSLPGIRLQEIDEAVDRWAYVMVVAVVSGPCSLAVLAVGCCCLVGICYQVAAAACLCYYCTTLAVYSHNVGRPTLCITGIKSCCQSVLLAGLLLAWRASP
jgi:hypothetical protein